MSHPPVDASAQFADLLPHWPLINALLDEGLALPPGQRMAWLAALTGPPEEVKTALTRLLSLQADLETGSFLADLPTLGHLPDSMVDDGAPKIGDLVGPYRLIDALGSGGMGSVWLAERPDGQPSRRVALKLPRAVWGAAIGQRMARERDILAALEHPHIARLYEAGLDTQGRPYLAMEYVEGQPIDVYCQTRQRDLPGRIALLLQVAAAVSHAHSRQIVHRDLKPANIFVTADGQVRLLDFGIAKLLGSDPSQTSTQTEQAGRALTLDYASPEQIAGQPLSPASDIYSLGVVAYELLAGTRPYRLKRGSATELEQAIMQVDAPLASRMASEPAQKRQLRGDLDAILNKALKKSAAERYATVEALAQDLAQHLQGRPVSAQPDRLIYRLNRLLRRQRRQFTAAGLALLSLLLAVAGLLWQADRAGQQAARADVEARALRQVSSFMLDSGSRFDRCPPQFLSGGVDTMAKVARAEVAKAEVRFAGRPLQLAEVYASAAALFNCSQLSAESLDLARKAQALLQPAIRGPLRLAEAELQIAIALVGKSDLSQALQHVEAGLSLLPKGGDGPAQKMRSRLLYLQADIHGGSGQMPQSAASMQAALDELGPEHRLHDHDFGEMSVELARLKHAMGDDQRPLKLLQEVRTAYREHREVSSTDQANLDLAEGLILSDLGQSNAAEPLLRNAGLLFASANELRRKSSEGVDAFTARALYRQGRYQEARALLDDALPSARQHLGRDVGRLIARVQKFQLELELDYGDTHQAAIHLQQLKTLTSMAASTRLRVMQLEARLMAMQGQVDAARALLLSSHAKASKIWGDEPRLRQDIALSLARLELNANQAQAATAALHDLGRPTPDTRDQRAWLAADLQAEIEVRRGDFNAALTWYRSPLAGLTDSGAPALRSPRDEALARYGFAKALRGMGLPAEAAQQQVRVKKLLEAQHPLSPLRKQLLD